MCFVFFGREIWWKKREKKCPNSSQNVSPFNLSCQEPLIGPGTLFRARRTLAISSSYTFSFLTLDAYLEVFLHSDWGNLGVLGKLWMSSFKKTKEIKIPIVQSKIMTSGNMLTRFSRFSQYLNCFNSDFDPWIVVGMRIWLSSQWHWIQPVLTTRSILGFLGPIRSQLRVKFGQTWSKFLKISKELEFDIKPWKMLFCEDFDLVWPLLGGLFWMPSHMWFVWGIILLGLSSFWGIASGTQHWVMWSNGY